MARTAIATDSNSGITQSQAKELGVFVLPMPFFMRGKIQFEDIDLTQEQFYEILAEDAANVYIQDLPEFVALNKKYTGYEFYPLYVQDIAKLKLAE
jgi:fatty acid-binding protein DegV